LAAAGAALKLVSVTGRGSMFSVTVSESQCEGNSLADDRASPAGIAVSIMVVEDEGDVLDIMVQLLTPIFHGATVCGGVGRFDIGHPVDDEIRHLPYRL
jgi:hypothetical protein